MPPYFKLIVRQPFCQKYYTGAKDADYLLLKFDVSRNIKTKNDLVALLGTEISAEIKPSYNNFKRRPAVKTSIAVHDTNAEPNNLLYYLLLPAMVTILFTATVFLFKVFFGPQNLSQIICALIMFIIYVWVHVFTMKRIDRNLKAAEVYNTSSVTSAPSPIAYKRNKKTNT